MRSEPPSGAGPAQHAQSRIGAQIIVDTLLDHGVETVVGCIGASVLPLSNWLYDARTRLRVPCREQGGGHMADGYAPAERMESGCGAVETS